MWGLAIRLECRRGIGDSAWRRDAIEARPRATKSVVFGLGHPSCGAQCLEVQSSSRGRRAFWLARIQDMLVLLVEVSQTLTQSLGIGRRGAFHRQSMEGVELIRTVSRRELPMHMPVARSYPSSWNLTSCGLQSWPAVQNSSCWARDIPGQDRT